MSEYIFKLPDLGEGTVESEIAEWMVKVGDVVQEEDTICAMLTDKAAVELSAPVSGRVMKLAGEVGDTIAVGTPLVTFDTSANAGKSSASGASAPAEPTAASATNPPIAAAKAAIPPATTPAALVHPDGKVKTSPSIRQRAREAQVDIRQVPGTGPRGRILKADFETYLTHAQSGATSAPQTGAATTRTRATGETEIKVIGLRRKIAQRMEQANLEVPHFAYVEEIDVTALEDLRQYLNRKLEAGQETLSLLPFIALGLVRVLQDFPQCNAHYDKDRNVLIRHHAVHLGVATQTGDGLKVPVVRHAEARSLQDIAAEIRRVAAAARDNTATRDELTGSTITLTSLGKLGGVVSTPIINLPEVAIIGVNKAIERPVVHKGQIAIRTQMNLSSSFDHRFVDGYDAAAMIQGLKHLLEQPATLFM